MAIILLTLIVVAAFLGMATLLKGDTGLITVKFGEQINYEMTFIDFAFAAVIFFIVAYYIFRIIGGIIRTPKKMKKWKEESEIKKSGRKTQQGYADLIKGDFASAEKKLVMAADKCSTPLLNYLAAAHAAHQQGHTEKREQYFKLAYESDPSSNIAIEINKAEMYYESGDIAGARNILEKIQHLAPKNEQIQRMLLETNRDTHSWDGVIGQLPKLKKIENITEEEISQYSFEACASILEKADDTDELNAAWKKLSRKQKAEADYKHIYANRLIDLGKPFACEQFIKKAVNKSWDSELVYLYGIVDNDNKRQLKTAKSWLKNHGDDANLLLTLGRISLRLDDKEAAKEYFEKALEVGANEEADRELARMMEAEGDIQKALEYYRSCMNKISPYADEEKPLDNSNAGDSEAEAENLEENKDIIIVDSEDDAKQEAKTV